MKFLLLLVLIISSPTSIASQFLVTNNSDKNLFKNEIPKNSLIYKSINKAEEANNKGEYKKAVSILEDLLLTNNLEIELLSDMRLEIYLQLSYAYKKL